jgi:predicted DNA-binding transcriptional regulator AlpA
MSDPIFLDAAAVAARIGAPSPQVFLAQREELEDTEAFPPPMPTARRPLRWKAAHVDAWLKRQDDAYAARLDARFGPSGPHRLRVVDGGRA